MGSIKAAIDNAIGKDNADQIKERLELLLVAAKAKIKGYRDEINEQFMNPAQVDKIQVPGIRALRYIEQYHVASSSTLNKQFTDHLDLALDSFFSIGDKGGDDKNSIKEGIKSIVASSLDAFIGSTEAGESEEKIYFIVPENNSITRVDVSLWKYHLTDKSITENNDTAVAYILCKSVVDHTKITLDELIYLISDALNNQSYVYDFNHIVSEILYADNNGKFNIKKEGNFNKEITLNFLTNSSGDKKIVKNQKQDPEDPNNWLIYSSISDLKPKRTPPTIQQVEAYLDELIKIWKKLRLELKDEQTSN